MQFLTNVISTLLLTALLGHGNSAPHKRLAVSADLGSKPTATMNTIVAEDEYQCVPLDHPYCNQVYHFAVTPNPRGLKMNEAIVEFSHFAPLMDTGCSDKLGTLLCFLYFPLCSPDVKDFRIMPCRSLCEEVVSDCGDSLAAIADDQLDWSQLPHFNCSAYTYTDHDGNKKDVYIEEDKKCANATQPSWHSGILLPTLPKPIPTTSKDDLTPTEGSSKSDVTEDKEEQTEGEEEQTDEEEEQTEVSASEDTPAESIKTPACSLCNPDSNKCDSCKIRTGVNANTFVRNEYNFAFRCTLNSKDQVVGCKWALNCTVRETFDIKSKEDCSSAPAIAPGTTVQVLGADTGCENCFLAKKLDLVIGEDYLVSGVTKNQIGNCDGQFLSCPGTSDESLITKWSDDKFAHETKKKRRLSTHICTGNKDRECVTTCP